MIVALPKASTHVLLDRVKDHSKKHADAICRATLLAQFHKAEKAKMPSAAKRLYAENLHYVTVSAPEQGDGLRWGDIEAADDWRSGLDKVFPDRKLESLVPSLISKEIDNTSVSVRTLEDGSRRLMAASSLKEGDVVLQASCLLFTTLSKVTEFLNSGGNSVLLEGPIVRINGLLDDTGSSRTIFAVLVGAAMFIGDFRGKTGRPNVTLRVKPTAGPNHGILEYVVTTRMNISCRKIILGKGEVWGWS